MTEDQRSDNIKNVLITGASGFVGRYVVREVLKRGLNAVCLVSSADKLMARYPRDARDRIIPVVGRLNDEVALREAADRADAAIHLVGIIINRRLQGKTFRRVHVDGTKRVVEAVRAKGIRKYSHMSALGSHADAASQYHRTKWEAEQLVRLSGLDWTIFRPSIIHGYDGEFMQLMKAFVTGLLPPIIPCFGDGSAKLQPVAAQDVAYCMVEALFQQESCEQSVALGGPNAYTWRELYETCKRLIPSARRSKPIVCIPLSIARLLPLLASAPLAIPEMLPGMKWLGKFRFDAGQVAMAQEDSVCDHREAETMFGLQLRSFETELAEYAGRI